MPLYINTNVSSINARANVDKNQSNLSLVMQKLSSGLRINSAKDDASGLAVTEGLNSRIRGNEMGIRNANDGISLAQTAEGALGQLILNFQRIREVSVQSANDSINDGDRSKLQAEVDQLTQEISRIIQTTEFNGIYLLNTPNATDLTFQIGSQSNINNQIRFTPADVSTFSAFDDPANPGTPLTFTDGNPVTLGYSADLNATGIMRVTTLAEASANLVYVDSALSSLITERARYGAIQSRFDAVISNMKNYTENLTAARSRIQDTDFAAETANLTRNQILQQAGVAMLSQANQLPQSALQLLK